MTATSAPAAVIGFAAHMESASAGLLPITMTFFSDDVPKEFKASAAFESAVVKS